MKIKKKNKLFEKSGDRRCKLKCRNFLYLKLLNIEMESLLNENKLPNELSNKIVVFQVKSKNTNYKINSIMSKVFYSKYTEVSQD